MVSESMGLLASSSFFCLFVPSTSQIAALCQELDWGQTAGCLFSRSLFQYRTHCCLTEKYAGSQAQEPGFDSKLGDSVWFSSWVWAQESGKFVTFWNSWQPLPQNGDGTMRLPAYPGALQWLCRQEPEDSCRWRYRVCSGVSH